MRRLNKWDVIWLVLSIALVVYIFVRFGLQGFTTHWKNEGAP